MLTKRLIGCLDVVDGMVTKAVKFQNNIPISPAVEVMARLYADGIDEIIFFDIKASVEKRLLDIETVREVASKVFVPFTVGGGIRDLDDMHTVLKAGAEKISIDSMAVRNPAIIRQGADAFGSQCIVVSMQVKQVDVSSSIPSGYEIAIDGARHFTGMDAVEWAREATDLGAGELCVNSIDRDGTHGGYDLELMELMCEAVNVSVIASGGAGELTHISDLFKKTDSSSAIVSSMLYSPRLPRNFKVAEMKRHLREYDIHVRTIDDQPG
jgi:imidazole glycerol-phosphate synthase subunit HisF